MYLHSALSLTILAATVSMPALADDNLTGIVDLHVHPAPDTVPRSIDDDELARLACEAGLRAVALKNHWFETASRAQLLRQRYPCSEFYGGIVLNHPTGGLNASAIARMAELGGRIVWLPTRDIDTIALFDAKGLPLPGLRDVLQVIADHDLVLATGHASPRMALEVIALAKGQGIDRILVTHPLSLDTPATVEQLVEMAARGAFIELTFLALAGNADLAMHYAEIIERVGAGRVVLTSDLGQPGNPDPPAGLLQLRRELASRGITEADLDRMMKENPARLLRQ